jgi:hypothetical protein
MAQEVTAMFQELCSLADRHAELHADRARDAERRGRLEMDVAGLQSELEQAGVRIADLKAEDEHQAQQIDRLSADLDRARWPWRRLISRES